MGNSPSWPRLIEKEENTEAFITELSKPGVDINAASGYYTPLYNAVWFERLEALRWLLAHPQIDPNRDAGLPLFRWCPLYLAVHKQSLEMVRLLLQHPETNPNQGYYNTPFLRAIELESLPLVEEFLQHPKLAVNYGFGYTPVTKAIYMRSAPILRAILRHPQAELAQHSGALLCLAVKQQETDLLADLVRHPSVDVNVAFVDPSDPNATPFTALYQALLPLTSTAARRKAAPGVWQPDLSGAGTGAGAGAAEGGEGAAAVTETAEHTAWEKAAWKVVDTVLSAPGLDPNKGQGQSTPLHLCAEFGLERAARALLETHGSKVDLALLNEEGQDALAVARAKAHTAVIALLENHAAVASRADPSIASGAPLRAAHHGIDLPAPSVV